MNAAAPSLPLAAPVPRWRSLQLRFMLMVLIGAVLFSTVVGALAWRLAYQRAVASSRGTLVSLAVAVEKTLATGAYARDKLLLQEVADGLIRNELVASVDLRTPAGEVLVHSRWAKVSDQAPASAGVEQQIVRILSSPFDAREPLAVLRLVADEDRIAAVARDEALTQASLMVCQAALVALMLYVVGARLVSTPIVRLARQMQAMSPGTHERLSTPPGNRHDEIGQLIHGANALLEANDVALQRERALRVEIEAMEAQYRQIFDSSSAGIFVLDAQGRLINGNPTVSKVVGQSMASLRSLESGSFLSHVFADPDEVQSMIQVAGARGQTVSGDLQLLCSGQTPRWVHCLISVQGQSPPESDVDPAATVEGVIYDITERKSAELAVRYQAEHDALTGLKNRAASEAMIDLLVDEARETGGAMALLCIDLDGFKQVNDEWGHHAGDQVLVACAHALRAGVRRESDLVGRLGGDEFVVALRGVAADDPLLSSLATGLLDRLCQPVLLEDGQSVRVGASIGIAVMARHGKQRVALMQAADEALYYVKGAGKNSFALALT